MRLFVLAGRAAHRKQLYFCLEGFGHEVVGMAASLAQADEQLKKLEVPEAIIADHMLPDGRAVALAEIAPRVPVLALVERGAVVETEEAVLYAATLQRPFDPATLGAGIQGLAFWAGEEDEADTV